MMRRLTTNTRITAVLSINGTAIHYLGEGIYRGNEVPSADAAVTGTLTAILREQSLAAPRFELDNGDVVYGSECWWQAGTLVDVLSRFPGRTLRTIRIADARAQARKHFERQGKN